MENIEKALNFLQNTYNSSTYFKQNPSAKEYRYQHTLRVSKIALYLSEKENLDNDVVIIGALLHDISYANEFKSKEDWINHGRNSAKMSEDFLNELDLAEGQKEEILFGIASHVDGNPGMDRGELTINALTISDSDNLDRFDIYRTFESLSYHEFYDKTVKEQISYLKERLKGVKVLQESEEEFATKTAKNMWMDRLLKQKDIYQDLSRQLEEGSNFLKIVQD